MRCKVPDCDVFQTVYFPALDVKLYRATLTGDLLTLESLGEIGPSDLRMATDALGLNGGTVINVIGKPHTQAFGKIVPVPEGERRALLHKLTQEYSIYTLGRFATWRNILLDDVYDDIFSIRKMMALSHYDMTLERSK